MPYLARLLHRLTCDQMAIHSPSHWQEAGRYCHGRIFLALTQSLFRVLLATLALGISVSTYGTELTPSSSRLLGLGISINDPSNAVGLAKVVGANAIRIDAPWKQIERTAGKYVIPAWLERTVNSMVNSGVTPLLILAYGNPLYDAGNKPTSRDGIEAFARYAAFVVEHFQGRVIYYDLWNEWDAHTGGTTPLGANEYVNLARVVFPAMKAVDHNVQVLSGGISDKGMREGFFEQFFLLGGHEYIDGLSLHPYVWNSRKRNSPEGAMEFVDQVAKLARKANGGKNIPVYLTEVGWPTHTGKDGITDEEAAWYLTRYYLLAASREYVRGVFWYCLMDQGNDSSNKEHRFGILSRNQGSRPAAVEFKNITGRLAGDTRVSIRLSGPLTIAEITRSGILEGRYTWEEGATAKTVGDALKSSLLGEKAPVDAKKAPIWQPAAAGVKVK